LGHVPGRPERVTDVHEWVSVLNAWGAAEVVGWIAQPEWRDPNRNTADDYRGGMGLMDYARPGCLPSVIYGRHLQGDGMPQDPPKDVIEKLNAHGLHRLVVGHTPHGNCPTIIRSSTETGGLQVVMADTSYSDMRTPDNRGSAVSTVDVRADDTVHVAGVLHDGTEIDYMVHSESAGTNELLGYLEPATMADGTPVHHRRFSKAFLPKSNEVLMCHVDGFKTTYSHMGSKDFAEARALDLINSRPLVREDTYTSLGDRATHGANIADGYRRQALEILFSVADTDGDAELSLKELSDALTKDAALLKVLADSGRAVPEVSVLLDAMDTDKTGQVSLNEFVGYLVGDQPLSPRTPRQSTPRD